MRLLLDTHALIWWVEDDRRIPDPILTLLEDPKSEVLVSAVSAMEISTKRRLGKLAFNAAFLSDFAGGVASLGFKPLSITVEHGAIAGAIESPHRDPFDRLLAAQSRIEGAALVTADPAFARLGVRVEW